MSTPSDITPTHPLEHEGKVSGIVIPFVGRRKRFGAGLIAISNTLLPQSAASRNANVNDRVYMDRLGPSDQQLKLKTYRLRVDRAKENDERPLPPHHDNGDESRYANKIGTDTRGLPHNSIGEVDLVAWSSLKRALTTQDPADFDKVILGGTRKLVNPLGALALNLQGASSNQFSVPPAPAIASAEKAAEAVELYWQSLLRDVPFHEYRNDTSHALVRAAANELTQLSGYTGPRDANGRVTPELLFRGTARYHDPVDQSGHAVRHVVPVGITTGPYISQFVFLDTPYGASAIPALLGTPLPGSDFLGHYDEWLATQNGQAPIHQLRFDPRRRYLHTGRDLAEFARGVSGLWSALQLLSTAPSLDPLRIGGIGAPLNPRNPYLCKFSTSTAADCFQSWLPLGNTRETRSTHWLKWFVHRTPRPEAYGGLIHNLLVNKVGQPIHPDVLNTEALARSHRRFGSHLLTSAYPEGAPNHGAYPGSAASSAAVQATLLKAFFDEDAPFPNPVQPDPNNPTKLIPYTGPALTIGGELNKLATNIGMGRNWAGIHWRSDTAASLPLAEDIAIAMLRDERLTFREPFDGFSFTRFDGSRVKI